MQFHVLNAHTWTGLSPGDVPLPGVLRSPLEAFETHYLEAHKGRCLKWCLLVV